MPEGSPTPGSSRTCRSQPRTRSAPPRRMGPGSRSGGTRRPPLQRHPVLSSSGTTGDPLNFALTAADLEVWRRDRHRLYARIRGHDVVAHLVGLPGWRRPALRRTGSGASARPWPGSAAPHRADRPVHPAPAGDRGAGHQLVRHLPGRPVPRADRFERLLARRAHPTRRRRTRPRPAGDPREDPARLGARQRARGHGAGRRHVAAVGRVRRRGWHALLRSALGHGGAGRPGQRRCGPLAGRRRGRGRLHHLRP